MQKVLLALRAAANAIEILAEAGRADEQRVQELCVAFLDNLQVCSWLMPERSAAQAQDCRTQAGRGRDPPPSIESIWRAHQAIQRQRIPCQAVPRGGRTKGERAAAVGRGAASRAAERQGMTRGTATKGTADTSHCPASNSEYLSPGYWDARYEREKEYEWFKSYAEFRHLISPYLRPKDRILILGCGNSSMSADLYREGFCCQTNIDISPVVVQRVGT